MNLINVPGGRHTGRGSLISLVIWLHAVALFFFSGIMEEEPSTIDTPPQFTMRLRDRRVQMTYPVRLTCQAVGFPYPSVVWAKDGEIVKQDGKP